MAVEALEECKSTVMAIPAIIPITMLRTPLSVQAVKKPMLEASRVGMDLDSKSSPRNKRPKPMMASPIFCFFNLFMLVKKKPIPKSGIARVEILKLNPKKATIHAVMVVPMLAPKIIPTDWVRLRRPAFTKETTITVVAPED